MTADQPTPEEGERPDGIDYESLAQSLLEAELEVRGDEVRGAFAEAASKARKGEELSRDDVDNLRYVLERAEILVEDLERAHSEFEEPPE